MLSIDEDNEADLNLYLDPLENHYTELSMKVKKICLKR